MNSIYSGSDHALNRDVEFRDDLEQDRHDEEGARQDWHAARVEEVRGVLERRMTTRPMADELAQAMANVLVDDVFPMACAWWLSPYDLGLKTKDVPTAELRKMADTAAKAQVQREEREQEGEAKRVRRVVLGDEL